MKRKLGIIICFFITHLTVFSQEALDPNKPQNNSQWKTTSPSIDFSFIDTNFGLSKHHSPKENQVTKTWQADAWRNETVHTRLAFWGNEDSYTGQEVELAVSDLKSEKGKIKKENITFAPIAYVLSDDPSQLKSGCGIQTTLDSNLVSDRILNTSFFKYEPYETRMMWLSITIPENTKPGKYTGTVKVKIGKNRNKAERNLHYTIQVSNRVLTNVDDWSFHLDIWQNPYSSARYYNVEAFSDDHLNLIKPAMQRLANAGQKNITASIIHDPWNSQTYDKYQSMIQWTKKKDGSWKYDYTNFDKWVDFMHSIGIDHYINCYSMIPWNLNFKYFDEEKNQELTLIAKPQDLNYKNHWLPFLQDFAKHLKAKGWFEKTTIAMDERPTKDMQAATAIIKEADKNFQISLAGYYHPELSDDIIDYSIPFHSTMDENILKARKEKGHKTTSYTCCTEIFPNTLTSSGYYEPTWLMLNTLQRGFDGYLRWSFDNWNQFPQQDARFGSWPAGDTFLIYPDNETSIRFENLRDGIQQVEKIKLLRKELQNNPEKLINLESYLNTINNQNITRELIPYQVKKIKTLINSL